MSRPFRSRSNRSSGPLIRINGKIRAREVRVVDTDGGQLGVLSVGDALTLSRNKGVDLVEIAPNAQPPVCRLVDYGKFRYEQAKKEKESKKHQHATTVKEIQLRPRIDPHDLGVKVGRAIDFLCEDMKLKVVLRFRGREMAHTEIGFEVMQSFVEKVTGYGTPDFEPRRAGRTIVLMVSPLPKNKRAKHPGTPATAGAPEVAAAAVGRPDSDSRDRAAQESSQQQIANAPISSLESTGT